MNAVDEMREGNRKLAHRLVPFPDDPPGADELLDVQRPVWPYRDGIT